MKKYLFSLSFIIISLASNSQGIVFEYGTWKEIIAKAQQTGKPIFVDVYTAWCGPCRKMSNEVFSQEKVGQTYNANFICCKIDAEKGDGIEVAKKYQVKMYPTYLFVKPNGELFYNDVGARDAQNFITLSKSALLEMNDPKPLSAWDKEYLVKKEDPAFLLSYMEKRVKLGLSNASLFDEYLKLIPENERTSEKVVDLYSKEGSSLRINSFAYQNLLANKGKFVCSMFGQIFKYLHDGINNSINDASKTKNQQLLTEAINIFDQIPNLKAIIQKDELYMSYYKITGESDKYFKHASGYCNNYLMKMSVDSLKGVDNIACQKFEEKLKLGHFVLMDSSEISKFRFVFKNMAKAKISQSLNEMAWDAFIKCSDQNILQDALSWSKRSIEIIPEIAGNYDTYANLLYKVGRKKEALKYENEALGRVSKNDKQYNEFQEVIRKMKAGEKTW